MDVRAVLEFAAVTRGLSLVLQVKLECFNHTFDTAITSRFRISTYFCVTLVICDSMYPFQHFSLAMRVGYQETCELCLSLLCI